jgi:hypothetical protein
MVRPFFIRHCDPTGRREAPPDDRHRDLSAVAQRAKAEAIHSGHPKGGLLRQAKTDRELRFECQTADTPPHSRGGRRPRFAFRCPSKEGAGNAGCALHPRSRVQKAERKSHTSIQGSGGNPTFPAQWLYGLLRALPGVSGFLASVASRKLALWPGWAFAPPLRLDADH